MRGAAMDGGHKPTPAQRRRAVVTALVLGLTVTAIYFTFMLKFAR
jgi:hypothetical protein